MNLDQILESNLLRESGSTDEVRRALLRGANPNMPVNRMNDGGPIQILFQVVILNVITDRDAKVQLLLDAGARVMDRSRGVTLLHSACLHGRVSIARMLVSHGAAVNDRTDRNGFTPLHAASYYGHDDMCLFLLRNGADVDLKSTRLGETALHFASSAGRENTARVLLEDGGARVNEIDKDGLTPLHYAAGTSGSESVARLLLERGADMDAKDVDGETPLDAAVDEGHQAVVSVLIEAHGRQLLKQDSVHPALWAYVLAKVGERSTDMSRVGTVYSLLCEKPDLFSYRNTGRKRKRPDRFVPGI